MKLHISDESLRAATHCGKGFSCLDGDRKDICKVEACINKTVYLVKCFNDDYCFYKKSFGMEHYCVCPVRKEIYDKYKI